LGVPRLDILVRNGQVLDGLGNPLRRVNIGIVGDTIVYFGSEQPEASETIDASGKIVTPGFVDIHTHEDTWLLKHPDAPEKLSDGVTTLIVGNCGFSAAPLLPNREQTIRDNSLNFIDIPCDWSTMSDYLERLSNVRLGVNVGTLVGHNTIRMNIMGTEKRLPTNDELEQMKSLVRTAVEDGALGLSTGLIYVPGIYSDTDELVELARVVAESQGVYTSHIRGEASTLRTAVAEALRVGQIARVPVEISHHKASGRGNWGSVHETLGMIEAARENDVDVNCDVYPYTAGNTGLGTLIPSWVFSDGLNEAKNRITDPETRSRIIKEMMTPKEDEECPLVDTGAENILISYSEQDPSLEGKSLAALAEAHHVTAAEIVLDLVRRHGGSMYSIFIILFEMSEQDVENVLRHSLSMIASDSLNPIGRPHPRAFGTFSRVLARYVRERHLLTLEDAVRKMTSMPASKMGLFDRGVIGVGKKADLAILDSTTVRDVATYQDPTRYSEGIDYVLVNGKIAWEHDKQTSLRCGTVLKHSAPLIRG